MPCRGENGSGCLELRSSLFENAGGCVCALGTGASSHRVNDVGVVDDDDDGSSGGGCGGGGNIH